MDSNYVEKEVIYLVSQKYIDGEWHKLAKSQELFWWNQKGAIDYIKSFEPELQPCLAVFRAEITIDHIVKVFDGKDYIARHEAAKTLDVEEKS